MESELRKITQLIRYTSIVYDPKHLLYYFIGIFIANLASTSPFVPTTAIAQS